MLIKGILFVVLGIVCGYLAPQTGTQWAIAIAIVGTQAISSVVDGFVVGYNKAKQNSK